jgi:hypothetical protein
MRRERFIKAALAIHDKLIPECDPFSKANKPFSSTQEPTLTYLDLAFIPFNLIEIEPREN